MTTLLPDTRSSTRGETTAKTLSFIVNSVDCIACTPVFKRELEHTSGVIKVTPLAMLNRFNVMYDLKILSESQLKSRVLEIASNSGFKEETVVFLRR